MNKEEILAKLAAGELKVDEASKLLAAADQAKARQLVLQGQRQGRHQRLRLAADAGHALRRAMGPPAELFRRPARVHQGARREVEAQELSRASSNRQSSHPPASGVQPRAYAPRNTHQMHHAAGDVEADAGQRSSAAPAPGPSRRRSRWAASIPAAPSQNWPPNVTPINGGTLSTPASSQIANTTGNQGRWLRRRCW